MNIHFSHHCIPMKGNIDEPVGVTYVLWEHVGKGVDSSIHVSSNAPDAFPVRGSGSTECVLSHFHQMQDVEVV